MFLGLVGRKVGMTRMFDEQGASVAVTVLELPANRVTQLKNGDTDGYWAAQVTYGEKKSSRLNKPEAGHFAKAKVPAGRGLVEFALPKEKVEQMQVGQSIDVSIFEAGQVVDVTGTSKGKGFQGNIKRHNFKSQRASHGNSVSHNVPGSIGQCQDPGRVFKGKKMPGHMGNRRITTQNLVVYRVDKERNLLLIKGAVPGAVNGDVIVRPAVKVALAKGGVPKAPKAKDQAQASAAAADNKAKDEGRKAKGEH